MESSLIQQGQKAPSFSLAGVSPQGEVMLTEEALRGAPYLLYFYPKASTPGCTTQACDLRDALPELQTLDGAGLRVIGVSPDPVEKLSRFLQKQALTFTLLSDEAHQLAEAYGVWVQKKLYGREFMGIERSSFIINAQGDIQAIKRRVRPADHVHWVKDILAQL
ncbi:thioredoxin-dependent thiol peroxidase [Saccharibacter sp. 17.LH.SD]|uniref:thioredoxin-dependent thiol peroxidase n=1 Tax=Saccharibacter sp. 17.LH.SD TaxID=2689393 RepID=UPI001368C8E2|nr:thioredoxin-dependent thiol peroxidase [Saccharibacter sp. 17.LH.SD]